MSDAAGGQYAGLATRADVVRFIAAALGDEQSPFADKSAPSGGHKKAGRSHFGRVELRELLDMIYGGPPASDEERIK